ncbi:5-dehydro-2-deoxygluconokinase [Halanaerobaculum tunisiense]
MNNLQFDETKPLDLIALGRAGVDLNANEIHRPLEETETFTKYVGGSPANISIGMARLGKKVGFLGRVANDQFGRYITNYFENEGIDISNVPVDKSGAKTGLAFTEIKSPTESSILMYRNKAVDLQLCTDDIDEEYIKQAKILLISGTALSKNPSRKAALLAIEYARKNNVKVIFDIDYRPYSWVDETETGIYYTIAAEKSDIIIGSREEFDYMEKLTGTEDRTDEEVANRWFEHNSKLVVIKHGADGSTAYTKDGQSFDIKIFPVELLKSFGGGDAYASAFIYGLLEDWDVIDALEFGSASASMLVSAHSCSEAMPTVEEIKKFIKEKKEEYGERVARV